MFWNPRSVLFAMAAAIFSASECQAQQAPLQRIAFGSCADQSKPQPIWEPIVAARPELFLFIGDTIYADTRDMEVMKKKYAQLAARPGYQKLLKSCPLMAVWDDHDYGANDAGAEYPKKKESQQIFLEFFKEPKDSPRWTRPGIYDARVFGPPDKSVQVILLDTRYFRSPLKKRKGFIRDVGPYLPDTDPKLTMLGDDQWQWLDQQLKVPAKVRLFVSTIQVVAEDHGWEKWMNMPLERDRLYKLIKSTGAGGVVILSGDRHLAELSMMDAGIGYPLYDLTSSGLTQASAQWRFHETNKHRVASMNQGNNFGMVNIDWSKADPLLSLQIRDEAGDVMIQQKLPLSVLQPGFLGTKKGPGEVVRLEDGALLTGEEIKKRLDMKVTIVMKVHGTGASATAGLVFLNSHDRSSDDNFTVVLDSKAQEGLKKAGIDDPQGHFRSQTVVVRGTLSLFRDRPQIMVSEAGQIEVQKKN
jgi:alkaline phosphatase D